MLAPAPAVEDVALRIAGGEGALEGRGWASATRESETHFDSKTRQE